MRKTFDRAAHQDRRGNASSAEPLAAGDTLTDDLDPQRSTLTDPLAPAPIFLKAVSSGPPEDPDRSFDRATSGSAGPLPYRGEMEQAFSTDFSHVDAHVGSDLSDLGAEAATRGSTVVFRDTHPSKETVAHELTHVVQCGSGGAASGIASPGSAAEREADAAASAVTSGTAAEVSSGPGAAIQLRAVTDGNHTVDVPDDLNAAKFRTDTYVKRASRGDTIKRIEDFLDLVHNASTIDDLRWAVTEGLAAIQGWQDKHANSKTKSVNARKPTVQRYKDKLLQVQAALPPANQPPQPPPGAPRTTYSTASGDVDMSTTQRDFGEDYDEGSVASVSKTISDDIAATPLGAPGAGADIHGNKDTSYKALNDSPQFGIAEGSANTASGLVNFAGGIHQMVKGKGAAEKTKGAMNTLAGAGTATGGVAKIVSSAQKAGSSTPTTAGAGAGAVSDGALGAAGGLSALSEATDFVTKIGDAKDWKNWSFDESLNFVIDRGKNLISVTKGVADSVNGFTKMATGAANAGAASVSGAMGVATGSIDVLKGGFDLAKAGVRRGELTDLQRKIDKALEGLTTQIDTDTPQAIAKANEKIRALDRALSTETDDSLKAQLGRIQGDYESKKQQLEDQLPVLRQQKQDLEQAKTELTPTIEAMRKVQKRSQGKAGFKMATGAIDVATGALVLSGIGAPVAIALAVFNGLLRLGNVALDTGRKWKASKLGELAQRLDSQGRPKGKAEPQEVPYREMERRVENAYYKHYDAAIDGVTRPPGFTKGEWGDVRDFVQDVKKADAKHDHGDRAGARAAGAQGTARTAWGSFKEGSKTYNEKPSGFRKVDLFFTFSAHKSEQAVDASNSDLASAVIDIAMGSFDPTTKQFVPTQVTTQDPAKGMRAMAAKVMLSNVGVSEKTWIAMWRRNGGWFAGDDDGNGGNHADTKGPNRDALLGDIKRKISAL